MGSKSNEDGGWAGNVLRAGGIILAGHIQLLCCSQDTPSVAAGWGWIGCHLYFDCCKNPLSLQHELNNFAFGSSLQCCSFSSALLGLNEQTDPSRVPQRGAQKFIALLGSPAGVQENGSGVRDVVAVRSCVRRRMCFARPLLCTSLLVCVILLTRKPTDLFFRILGGSLG